MRKYLDMTQADLTRCESIIMNIIWSHNEPVSTGQIIKELKEKYHRDYARTTVVTFGERMEKKGFIKRHRSGRIGYMSAVMDKNTYLKSYFQDAVDFWLDGDVSRLAMYVGKEDRGENS